MRTMTALLAEDDFVTRKCLANIIGTLGLKLDVTHDGAQALQRCKNQQYDIVMTDLAMPTLDGFGLIKSLREMKDDSFIIVITGSSDRESLIRCFELGAEDYILKGTPATEIVARIKVATRVISLQRQIRDQQTEIEQIISDTKLTQDSLAACCV